jgi:hypothetical protein
MGKCFLFFDPETLPVIRELSTIDQSPRPKLFNKNVEKFVEKPSRTSVTVRTANT